MTLTRPAHGCCGRIQQRSRNSDDARLRRAPAATPTRTTAPRRASRSLHWPRDRRRSPPCRDRDRRRETCRRETTTRTGSRRRCRRPWRHGSGRRTAGRIPPAWRGSSPCTPPACAGGARPCGRATPNGPACASATSALPANQPGRAAPATASNRRVRERRIPPPRASRTFHHDLVGVFGTDGQRRIPLVGAELAQPLRQRGVHLLRA